MTDQTPAQWLVEEFERKMATRDMTMGACDGVHYARYLFEVIDLIDEIRYAHSRMMRWYPQGADVPGPEYATLSCSLQRA